jgi:hypothetical protein
VLGAILSAFYRTNVVVAAASCISGCWRKRRRETSVAPSHCLDAATAKALPLIDSARAAFDSGVGATSVIAVILLLRRWW